MAELTERDEQLEDKVVIDTNLLLDDSKILFKLTKKYKQIVIPLTVLKELDKHKFKQETAFSARQAIRALIDFKENYRDRIIFDVGNLDIENDDTNDAKIIRCAKEYEAVLATKDMSMDIIAESLNVKTKLYDVVLNNIFNPYLYIEQTELFSENGEGTFGYGRLFDGYEYEDMFELFERASKRTMAHDSWFFVIINTPTENPTVYAHNPLKKIFQKIDDDPNYRKLNISKGISLKALDIYQTCAIYAMVEAPNVLICGSYGSGKSLLSTAYALAYGDKKTFITRPNITVDSRFKLGFLPGTIGDKLEPWMAGVISGLYNLFSNTRSQKSDKFEDKSDYDFVKEIVFKKYFEMMSLETIQGMSFMEGDLLLLDETQLCSIAILATILSRFGKGSKLIAIGDIKQVYGVIPPSENGLLKLLRLLPNKSMAYVELKNNYRSDLLDLANELQDKTLF